MAQDNRTEDATPRRRWKARERAQVARSRELPTALSLLTVIILLTWVTQDWRGQWRELITWMLTAGRSDDLLLSTPLLPRVAWTVMRWVGPLLFLAWAVAVGGTVAQGGFVISTEPLTPNVSRLNPVSNLQRLLSLGGLSTLLKSLVPIAFIVYLAVGVLARDWDQVCSLARVGPRASLFWMLSHAFEISWKAGLVFLIWSAFDYLLQWFNFENSLKMTKTEVQDDFKETEGNPVIRRRIRQLQRQMRRRRMLHAVARATVVVTNPDEYAVALEYRPTEMPAPVVMAKGRNLLAQLIKREARWHNVPLVENPPLAQALYRAVEVGQAIPAKLYAAVAEILAFIYRTQARAPAGAVSSPPPPRG